MRRSFGRARRWISAAADADACARPALACRILAGIPIDGDAGDALSRCAWRARHCAPAQGELNGTATLQHASLQRCNMTTLQHCNMHHCNRHHCNMQREACQHRDAGFGFEIAGLSCSAVEGRSRRGSARYVCAAAGPCHPRACLLLCARAACARVCAHASRSDPSIAQRPALQDVTFPVGRERSPHDSGSFFDMVRAAAPAACACTVPAVPSSVARRCARARPICCRRCRPCPSTPTTALAVLSAQTTNCCRRSRRPCPRDQAYACARIRAHLDKCAPTCVHGRMDAQAPIVDVGPRAWLEEQRLLLRDTPLGQVCLPAMVLPS